MPGLEPVEDEAAFEDGEPFACCGLRDAYICGEAVEVEELPDSTCAETDESLKKAEVLDLQNLS